MEERGVGRANERIGGDGGLVGLWLTEREKEGGRGKQRKGSLEDGEDVGVRD